MKQFLKAGVVMLAFFGLNAAAQDWYHDRDARFQGQEWRMHLFEHVRTDLDHIGSAAFASPRERKRLDITRHELDDLQSRLGQPGRYNEHELNDAIDSLVKSSNDQRLSPRDRQVLADDANRMKEYRAHHEGWGH